MRQSVFRRLRPVVLAALAGLATLASAETVNLKDGTMLKGEIVSRTDSLVILRTEALGELRIPVSALYIPLSHPGNLVPEGRWTGQTPAPDSVRTPVRESNRPADPSDQALFFLPTAFTPPARSFMFRDFELLFLTAGYAPTSSTTVTGGLLFPISSEVQVLTAGFKQQLFNSKDRRTALAITGNVTNPIGDLDEEVGLALNSNLVLSMRMPRAPGEALDGVGFHLAAGYLGIEDKVEEWDPAEGYRDVSDWRTNFSFGGGAEFRLTRHAKFMAEYLSAMPFDADADFEGGILTLGFRLHGERLSADIAGLRPVTGEDLDGFVFWPLLVVSYRI